MAGQPMITSVFGSNGPAVKVAQIVLIDALSPFNFQLPPTQKRRDILNYFEFSVCGEERRRDKNEMKCDEKNDGNCVTQFCIVRCTSHAITKYENHMEPATMEIHREFRVDNFGKMG